MTVWCRSVVSRGGVEDNRLEAKAKDTKKVQGQGQPSEDRPSRGQGQECSRPRTKATCTSALKKKGSQNFFQAFSEKKRSSKNIFKK